MQDVGTRLYTFIWSMYDIMQAAAPMGITSVILDRPNPIGGLLVEGPVLNITCCGSRYGMLYGMNAYMQDFCLFNNWSVF